MPLHRDIHWIGRQWAVTGHGMQLIDQKLQGFFDIEVGKLWDENRVENIRAKEWLNTPDFVKGLALARARYPQPSGAVTPPRQVAPLPAVKPVAPPPAIEPVAPLPPVVIPEAPKPEVPKLTEPVAVEPPKPPPSLFQMHYEGRAKFVRPWRVVVKRQI